MQHYIHLKKVELIDTCFIKVNLRDNYVDSIYRSVITDIIRIYTNKRQSNKSILKQDKKKPATSEYLFSLLYDINVPSVIIL